EQVLWQVEEAGPERRAVRRRVHARPVAETGKRSEEDGQLEVRLRDAQRRHLDARAIEYRRPLEHLGGAGSPVPGATLGALRLKLEQVAAERPLEPRQSRLGPVRRAAQRRLAA